MLLGGILIACLLPVPAGAVTVERFEISAKRDGIFAANVSVAVNTKSKESLVVWERHPGNHPGHSLWGRLLDARGKLVGGEFQIVSGPNTYKPRVAYISTKNQFVLVFSNELSNNGRFALQGQLLNAKGRPIGGPAMISDRADAQLSVANYNEKILYDEKTDGIIVVWMRYGFGTMPISDEGIYGCVTNSDLSMRRLPVLLSRLVREGTFLAGPTVTDLALHTPSGKLLIAGYTITNPATGFGFRYFVSRTDAGLSRGNIALTPLKAGTAAGAAPDVSLARLPNGQTVAFYVEGTGVRRRAIGAAGSPTGPISFLFGPPATNIPLEYPEAATSGSAAEVAIVGQEDSTNLTGKMWLQTLSATGAIKSGPIEIQSGYSGGAPPAVSLLPQASANGSNYAVVYIEGLQTTVPPMPGENSIPVLLRVNTQP
jgi:hypothetical protein